MKRAAMLLAVVAACGCLGPGRPPPGTVPAGPSVRPGPLAATVFTDEYSKGNLALLHADPDRILDLANQNFAAEGIAAGYDLSKLRKSRCRPRGRIESFWPIVNYLMEEARSEFGAREAGAPDVIVFLTGRLTLGTCLALTRMDVFSESARAGGFSRFLGGYDSGPLDGRGVIIIGTDTEDSDPEGARRLALLLMHEQAHLYGVGHARQTTSIMHQHSDRIIGGDFATVRFDPDSRSLLRE